MTNTGFRKLECAVISEQYRITNISLSTSDYIKIPILNFPHKWLVSFFKAWFLIFFFNLNCFLPVFCLCWNTLGVFWPWGDGAKIMSLKNPWQGTEAKEGKLYQGKVERGLQNGLHTQLAIKLRMAKSTPSHWLIFFFDSLFMIKYSSNHPHHIPWDKDILK